MEYTKFQNNLPTKYKHLNSFPDHNVCKNEFFVLRSDNNNNQSQKIKLNTQKPSLLSQFVENSDNNSTFKDYFAVHKSLNLLTVIQSEFRPQLISVTKKHSLSLSPASSSSASLEPVKLDLHYEDIPSNSDFQRKTLIHESIPLFIDDQSDSVYNLNDSFNDCKQQKQLLIYNSDVLCPNPKKVEDTEEEARLRIMDCAQDLLSLNTSIVMETKNGGCSSSLLNYSRYPKDTCRLQARPLINNSFTNFFPETPLNNNNNNCILKHKFNSNSSRICYKDLNFLSILASKDIGLKDPSENHSTNNGFRKQSSNQLKSKNLNNPTTISRSHSLINRPETFRSYLNDTPLNVTLPIEKNRKAELNDVLKHYNCNNDVSEKNLIADDVTPIYCSNSKEDLCLDNTSLPLLVFNPSCISTPETTSTSSSLFQCVPFLTRQNKLNSMSTSPSIQRNSPFIVAEREGSKSEDQQLMSNSYSPSFSLCKNESVDSDIEKYFDVSVNESPLPPRSFSAQLYRKVFAKKSVLPQSIDCMSPSLNDIGDNRQFNVFDRCRHHNLNVFPNVSSANLLELQCTQVIEWLREHSTLRLAQLFHQCSSDKSESQRKNKLMRFDLLRGFRNAIKNAKCKALNENYSTTIEPETAYKNLFGMPLYCVSSKTNNPLPRFICQIIDFILENAPTAEGIFRKNGVKLKINEIKERCSTLDVNENLPEDLLCEAQLHNLADVFKHYLRDLPECIMTNRISAMLESAALDLPEKKRFLAIQYCILLLPTENREALLLILKFFFNIAQNSKTNQMSAENLATCLMPSIFYHQHSASGPITRLTRRRTIGIPSERERNAYAALKDVLTQMIYNYEQLLKIPKDLSVELKYFLTRFDPPPEIQIPLKNGVFDFREEYARKFRQSLEKLKSDYLSGWLNWQLKRVYDDGTRLFIRKVSNDVLSHEFLVQTNIPTSANRLHAIILHKRHHWDGNVLKCQKIGASGQNSDVIKVTYGGVSVEKQAYLARWWTYFDIDASKAGKFCSLVERSIVARGVRRAEPRINVYKSEFLIVPNESNQRQCKLTYISRIDLRGKTSYWYKKVYGEMVAERIRHLRSKFVSSNYQQINPKNKLASSCIETIV